MTIGSFLKKIWRTDTPEPTRGFLTKSQMEPIITLGSIEPNKHYIRLYVRRLHIPHSRIGSTKYHGAMASELDLLHKKLGYIQLKKLIAPPELAGVPDHQRPNMKLGTKELAGPVPYRGERISLSAGLIAVESQELAGPFLATLDALGSAAGMNYVDAAKPFLEPLGKGMTLLAEAAGTKGLKIGIDQDFPNPESGVFVMVDIPKAQLPLGELILDKDYYLKHKSINIDKYSHFVLSIEVSNRRDDFSTIPDIKKAYEAVVSAVQEDKPDEIKKALNALERLLLFHPDLLKEHAKQLYSQIQEEVQPFLGATRTSSGDKAELRPLDHYEPFG